MSNLVFPDSLFQIWDWWHDPSTSQRTEISEEWRLWQKLEKRMKNKCRNPKFKDDAVHNALDDLFAFSSRDAMGQFAKEGYLIKKLKRDIALSQNPEGFDMDHKFRDAIHVLIKENKVQSTDLKKFTDTTRFKSASAPDVTAPYSNYEQNKSKIPFYKMKPRKERKVIPVVSSVPEDPDGTDFLKKKKKAVSIISPADAKDLVERLLNVFDGWVEYQDIKKAAWNHIPHSTLIEGVEDIDTKSEGANFGSDEEDIFQPKWDENSLSPIFVRTIKNRCEEIWLSITKITKVDFFCLYILPESIGGTAIGNLEDYGNDSTMSGQKRDVMKMLREQTTILFVCFGVGGQRRKKDDGEERRQDRKQTFFYFGKEKDLIREMMRSIYLFLNHRCKEKGYDPHIRLDGSKMFDAGKSN